MAHRLPGSEPTPAQAFDDAHLDGDVQAALKALPPEYRAAVVLCDIEGLSYEEIAATLGVKLGTVRSRIHRGRAQLRAALEHRRPPASHTQKLPDWPGSAVTMSHLGERLSALVDGELDRGGTRPRVRSPGRLRAVPGRGHAAARAEA